MSARKTFTFEEVVATSTSFFNGDTLAASVFTKYALQSPEGLYLESSPPDMHHRLAKEIARIEAKYPRSMKEKHIFGKLADWTIVPQGSPMSGIGNPYQIQSIGNCFVVNSPLDSYSGIMYTDQEMAQIMKRRGGVGHDISNLRPMGAPTQNAAKTTDGIGVFMERYSTTTREVAQKGRRGALMISISVHHPEIETFISIKKDRKKVTGANISIRITDEFMEAVKSGGQVELRFPVEAHKPRQFSKMVDARSIMDQIAEAAWDSAEPGVLMWDRVLRESPADCYADVGFRTTSTNPCFAPGTLVHTRKGHFPIESLVGKTVEVWDGNQWFAVDNFRVTAENQPILEVELHDGSAIRLTPYHRCILDDGTEILAKDLSPGMRLAVSTAPATHGTIVAKGAYLKGMLVADGHGKGGHANLSLYETKYVCMGRLIESASEIQAGPSYKGKSVLELGFGEPIGEKLNKRNMTGLSCRTELDPWVNEYKNGLPSEVFAWDKNSKLEFLAGFMDGDGTGSETERGYFYQISSISKQLLLDIQALLKTIGIGSKFSLMKTAGKKDFNDGYGKYEAKDCWRLHLSQVSAAALSRQIRFSRLRSFSHKTPMASGRGQFNAIKKVSPAGIEARVYCCTVSSTGSFSLTSGNHYKNCGELPLCPDDSCRLLLDDTTSFVDNPFTKDAWFDFGKFEECAYESQKIMDDMVDLELECIDKILAKIEADPEPEHIKQIEKSLWQRIRVKCEQGRRTGLGLTALGDTIAYMGLKYGSQESIDFADKIYKTLAIGSYKASIDMAEERGAFPIWDLKKEENHPFLTRILAELPVAYQKRYAKFGRRNIANLTTAPAGSVSCLTQTTSGCEPAIFLSYTRRRKINPGFTGKVDFVDELGDTWEEYKVYHHGHQKWMEITGETDETKSPYFGATAEEIDPIAKVRMQGAVQKWIDHAISNTTNLPESATPAEVANIYIQAWELGCKGVTVYRAGSRSGVLVKDEPKKEPKLSIIETNAPKRPEVLDCELHRSRIKGDEYLIIVGLLEGKPYEVFAGLAQNLEVGKKVTFGQLKKIGKKYQLKVGDETFDDVISIFDNPNYGAFTRTISTALRHGVPVKYLVEQFRKDKHSDLFSFSTIMARVFAKNYIKDGVSTGKSCPECNSKNINYVQGCPTCADCGFSKCG